MDEDPPTSGHPRLQASVLENAVSLRGASRALVAQVWIYNRSSKESHHVLSQADLIPDELPLIDVPKSWSSRLGKESEWTAYGESSLLRSEDALSWYDKVVHAGEWAPPWREPHLSQPVVMLNMLSEPAWPSVVTTHDAGTIPPVRGREVGTRHHHVLCEEPATPKLLDDDERGKLLGTLRDHGGVTRQKPQHWLDELVVGRHRHGPKPSEPRIIAENGGAGRGATGNLRTENQSEPKRLPISPIGEHHIRTGSTGVPA